jgi:branched-chain amino acid transport system permease protein
MVAASVGISETKFRVLALGVSCFVVGLVGAGYAHYNMVLSYSSFNLLASINMLVYMLIGGIVSFAGPIIGTAVLFMIPEIFRQLKEYTPFLFAGILLLVVFVMPQGLVGLFDQFRSLVNKKNN